MTAEDRIDRAKQGKRLKELVGNKQRTLEEANELVDMLVGYVASAQGAIIDMRDRMANQEGAIEILADLVAPKKENSGLVGIEKPQLIGIRKPN